MMKWLKSHHLGVLLMLYIQPGASRTEIVGLHGDRLKIRVKAPPQDGQANKELVNFLSGLLHLPKSQFCFQKGFASRSKDLLVEGAEVSKVLSLLELV